MLANDRRNAPTVQTAPETVVTIGMGVLKIIHSIIATNIGQVDSMTMISPSDIALY